jgi:hypothetical protein
MYTVRACYLLVLVLARTRVQDRIGVGVAPLPGAGPLVKYVAGRCREPRDGDETRRDGTRRKCNQDEGAA